MTALSSPMPPEDDSSQHRGTRRRQCPRTPQILSPQQCLEGLSQLPVMVVMDFLKPQKANAMRGVFNDLIRHQTSAAQALGGGLPSTEIIDLARKNPILLNALERMMTDDQFEALMNQLRAGDDTDASAGDNPDASAGDNTDASAGDNTDASAGDEAGERADTEAH